MRQLDEAEKVADGCYLPISMILNNVKADRPLKFLTLTFPTTFIYSQNFQTSHRKK